MAGSSTSKQLADNEALILVEEHTYGATAARRDSTAWEPTLTKVEITDAELDRLRRQVSWIAGKLADESGVDDRFAVDSVTLHVGINASGTFIWASAGVEVAVDVTWTRQRPPG